MNKNKTIYRLIAFSLGFFLLSNFSIAQAKSDQLKKLVKNSEVILHGKVINKNSRWNDDKTRIYTVVTISTDELLKGKINGNEIVLSTPGGEIGDVGEFYTHTAQFDDQEEVILFLKKDNREKLVILDGEDGKLRVDTNESNGMKTVNSSESLQKFTAKIKNIIDAE